MYCKGIHRKKVTFWGRHNPCKATLRHPENFEQLKGAIALESWSSHFDELSTLNIERLHIVLLNHVNGYAAVV